METQLIGRQVALTAAKAYDLEAGKETTISGLFVIDEFHPYEPAAYVHADCFTVIDPDDWSRSYSVDAELIEEQVNPSEFGKRMAEEREALLAMDDAA
jgi:hypothetical protein